MPKRWVNNDDEKPLCTGLYFIKHKDFLGDVDIAEYHINKKGKAFGVLLVIPHTGLR
jgi:hypothetical protein